MRKWDNTIQLSHDHEKALTKVGAFFVIQKQTVCLNKNIKGSVCPELIACFEIKIELENLHRNKAKKVVLHHATDQQLKMVVS
jgi:hypothetical protein